MRQRFPEFYTQYRQTFSKGQRNTRNSNDNIFTDGGDQLLLHLQGDAASGYNTAIHFGPT